VFSADADLTARRCQDSLAQGLPWEIRPPELALKGRDLEMCVLPGWERFLSVPIGPFKAHSASADAQEFKK
jgi:hypothetical protein